MRKSFALLAIASMLLACTAFITASAGDAKSYPEIDWAPTKSMSIGPNGEIAASLSDFSFTEEEKQKLRAGNYTVAICYHQIADQCNTVKLQAAKDAFADLGIKVVAVTDANLSVETQINDVESALALQPDVLLINPRDPDVMSATVRAAADAGIKIVFMEAIATGFKPGINCVSLVNSDAYGNGWVAAQLLAKEIGFKGTVGEVFYEAAFFVTNERDRGFEECMAQNYPDIKVVRSPFTDQELTGTNGDALMAQYPDLAGVYVSWEAPAEYIMASAKASGKSDLAIVTIDLGDTSALSIANGGMIKVSATSRSYEQGQCEAFSAAYALLGKKLPSGYITPVALPVDYDHLLEGYCQSYGLDVAPAWLVEAYNKK